MEQPILSIYIATYNRKEILLTSVKKLLSLSSDEFDIYILDDQSNDGTMDALAELNDIRVHVYCNEQRVGCHKDGVMPNWLKLAEVCDGIFSFHLNDRDYIDLDGLRRLIVFLKEHQNLVGGVCNLQKGYKIYSSQQSFLAIPYNAIHPTGVIFNTNYFHKIPNRDSLYTKEKSYIHPHDLVLGKLCEMGKLFEFEKIWSLAGQESFKANKSFLYKKGDTSTSWFSPGERIKEYELFLKAIEALNFDDSSKTQKVFQISKHYLFYCTLNYAYFLSDPGQAAHYGLEPQKLSFWQMNKVKKQYIYRSLKIQKECNLNLPEIPYHIYMNLYFLTIYLGKPVWNLLKKITKRK